MDCAEKGEWWDQLISLMDDYWRRHIHSSKLINRDFNEVESGIEEIVSEWKRYDKISDELQGEVYDRNLCIHKLELRIKDLEEEIKEFKEEKEE